MVESDLSNSKPSNIITIKRTKSIPLLGSIACGDPILSEENIEEHIPFPVELLPSGKTFFLKAQGDSMQPIINDGSLVLIRQQEDVESGEIAAVLLPDQNEATLKRVRKVGESIILEPINDKYEPYIVTENTPVQIMGKAVKTLNDL